MANVQTKLLASELFRTIVFRIINTKTNDIIKEHALAVLPQTFMQTPANRDTLQHTAGGIFIDRWGTGSGRITMTGVVLNKEVEVGGQKIDGAVRFKDLRDMLEDYTGGRNLDTDFQVNIRVGNTLAGPFDRSSLALHVLIFAQTLAPSSEEETAREWYEVHLPQNYFTFQKNVGDRHTNFPYTINLELIKRLENEPTDFFPSTFFDRDSTEDLKSRLDVALGRATEWANTIRAIAAKAESAVSGAEARIRKVFSVAGSLQDSITDFLILYDDVLRAFDRFSDGLDNFIIFPFRTVQEAERLARRTYDAYTNAIDFPDVTQEEIKNTIEVLGSLLSRPDLFLQPLVDSFGNPYKSSFRITVEFGTTLSKLSLEHGVPEDDIIKLNNLAYPYFDDFVNTDGVEQEGRKTLRVGDSVLIPTTTGSEAIDTPPSGVIGTDLSQEQRFYGIAWSLNRDGDMQGNSSKTGFLRVSGIDNVLQALRVRISTEKESFPIHPTYGLPRFIGQKATQSAIQAFKVDVHRQILSDPRVDAIENLSAEFQNGLLDIQVLARLKNARESTLLNIDGLRVS